MSEVDDTARLVVEMTKAHQHHIPNKAKKALVGCWGIPDPLGGYYCQKEGTAQEHMVHVLERVTAAVVEARSRAEAAEVASQEPSKSPADLRDADGPDASQEYDHPPCCGPGCEGASCWDCRGTGHPHASDAGHTYVSTACHHDRHQECRKICKFCTVPCQCPCGHKET